jgi:hypothetical protein
MPRRSYSTASPEASASTHEPTGFKMPRAWRSSRPPSSSAIVGGCVMRPSDGSRWVTLGSGRPLPCTGDPGCYAWLSGDVLSLGLGWPVTTTDRPVPLVRPRCSTGVGTTCSLESVALSPSRPTTPDLEQRSCSVLGAVDTVPGRSGAPQGQPFPRHSWFGSAADTLR